MNFNKILFSSLVLFCLTGINFGNSVFALYDNVLYSAEEGGDWNNPDSWIGGRTPDSESRIIISSKIYLSDNTEVAELIVNESGILEGNYCLKITGDTINYGKVQGGTLKTQGNITNNGDWINYETILIGDDPRYIDGDNPIMSKVKIENDIEIINSPVFGEELIVTEGNLTIANDQTLTLLKDLKFYGNDNVLRAGKLLFNGENQTLDTYKMTIIVDDFYLDGSGEKNIYGPGGIKLYGNLKISPGVSLIKTTASVYGNFINEGIVKSDYVKIYGNIMNNGVWEANKPIKIFWSKDKEADGYEFLVTNSSGTWEEPYSTFQDYYEITDLINESRSWKVRSKYSDGGAGEWSGIHTINAGNLFIDASNLFDEEENSATHIDNISATKVEISFSDVLENAFYKTELSDLTNAEIINGYQDGTFKPNQTINRAELLKIAMMAGNLSAEESGVKTYSDVKDGDWFNSYVQAATKYGIVKGYSDGSFRPGNLINRAEAIKVIILSIQPSGNNCSGNMRFNDVNQSDWFYDYVCRAEQLGILNMVNDNFEPSKEITRAEVVYWVGQLFD